MTAVACSKSRYGIIHPCPTGARLWDAIFTAHDALLRDGTAERRKAVDACWTEYQQHVAKCAGGKDVQDKS